MTVKQLNLLLGAFMVVFVAHQFDHSTIPRLSLVMVAVFIMGWLFVDIQEEEWDNQEEEE